MTSPTPPGSDLDAIVSRTRHLLLDFDGPICSIFAGLPAATIADRLRKLLGDHAQLPADIARTADPFEVFAYAATLSEDLAARVEAEMTDLELAAVPTAAPTPYVHEVVTACQNSGRSVAVVSNNSARTVHAYLTRHGLDDRISLVIARTNHDPGLLKPSPHLITQAVDALDAEPGQCTLVGDSVTDVQAAQPRQRPEHRLCQRTRQTRTPHRSQGRRHHQQPRRPGPQTPRTRGRSRVVTTFFTASRAHLRRAGPDGLAVNSQDGREQSRGKDRLG